MLCRVCSLICGKQHCKLAMVDGRNSSAHNMLVGFIAGISTVMALALLFYLFWKRIIPFLKQPKILKG